MAHLDFQLLLIASCWHIPLWKTQTKSTRLIRLFLEIRIDDYLIGDMDT